MKRYPIDEPAEVEIAIKQASTLKLIDVLQYLYCQSNDYFNAYQTLLSSENTTEKSFEFFKWCMIHESVSAGQKSLIKSELLKNVEKLMNSNPSFTSELIIEFFQDQATNIIKRLETYPEILFKFLDQLLKSSKAFTSLSPKNEDDTSITSQHSLINNEITERYIVLLCKFRRQDVYSFLISNENYNIEKITLTVKEFKIFDAAAYLLERTGDLQGSLALLIKMFYRSLGKLKKIVYENGPSYFTATIKRPEYLLLIKNLDLVSHLCERTSEKGDESSKEMWFCVLNNFLRFREEFYVDAPLRKLSRKRFSADLRQPNEIMSLAILECVRLLSLRMKVHVPVDEIMSQLSEIGSDLSLADIRNTLSSLFESITFDHLFQTSANRVFESDINQGNDIMHIVSSKAFTPKSGSCVTCGKPINDSILSSKTKTFKDIVIYECGHCFHVVSR
jgi:hypothetical protein